MMHFAAQTHVDLSFGNSVTFTDDNVLGTHRTWVTGRFASQIGRSLEYGVDICRYHIHTHIYIIIYIKYMLYDGVPMGS